MTLLNSAWVVQAQVASAVPTPTIRTVYLGVAGWAYWNVQLVVVSVVAPYRQCRSALLSMDRALVAASVVGYLQVSVGPR